MKTGTKAFLDGFTMAGLFRRIDRPGAPQLLMEKSGGIVSSEFYPVLLGLHRGQSAIASGPLAARRATVSFYVRVLSWGFRLLLRTRPIDEETQRKIVDAIQALSSLHEPAKQ